MHSPVEAPAPSRPAAVTPTGSVTAAASTLAAWIIDHARTDLLRGRPLPDEVAAHVRDLLTPPTTDLGTQPAPPATVEYTTGEVAARMGCSERYVRRLCQVGRLKAYRSGWEWRIAIEEEAHDDHPGRHPR